MALLSQLLIKKELGIPYGTILFLLNCLIVSIPLIFLPLHSLFAPNPSKGKILQFLICQFAHGTLYYPTWFHLALNLIGIVFLGLLVERSIGTHRLVLLIGTSWLSVTLYCLIVNIFGLGSSGIMFSYWPFVGCILYWDWTQRHSRVFRDPLYLVTLTLVIFGLIISILYWGPFHFTNMAHYTGILTGTILLFIWRKPFFSNLDEFVNSENEDIKVGLSARDLLFKKIAIFAFSIWLVCNTLIVSGLLLYSIS